MNTLKFLTIITALFVLQADLFAQDNYSLTLQEKCEEAVREGFYSNIPDQKTYCSCLVSNIIADPKIRDSDKQGLVDDWSLFLKEEKPKDPEQAHQMLGRSYLIKHISKTHCQQFVSSVQTLEMASAEAEVIPGKFILTFDEAQWMLMSHSANLIKGTWKLQYVRDRTPGSLDQMLEAEFYQFESEPKKAYRDYLNNFSARYKDDCRSIETSSISEDDQETILETSLVNDKKETCQQAKKQFELSRIFRVENGFYEVRYSAQGASLPSPEEKAKWIELIKKAKEKK